MLTITKLGETPKSSGSKKPKSILKTAKINPVKDPAKAPPFKSKSKTRKHIIKVHTPAGEKRHQEKIKKKIESMSSNDIEKKLAELKVSSKLPHATAKHILEGAMISGFISV